MKSFSLAENLEEPTGYTYGCHQQILFKISRHMNHIAIHTFADLNRRSADILQHFYLCTT